MHACLFVCICMSVDWDRRRRFESPRGQMCFFNDVPWQNIVIYIYILLLYKLRYSSIDYTRCIIVIGQLDILDLDILCAQMHIKPSATRLVCLRNNVHVHGNVGRSDHASLGVALNLSPAVAGFDVAHRVPLKSRVNWNAVCEALSGLNWRSIFRSPNMVHDFDREVSGIMERFVPMVSVRGRGGDAAWFDGDCRRAFELKQSAYHRWCRNRSAENWNLFYQARGTANRLYAAAKARYSADCRRNLDVCASANAWWRTLKGHVFGAIFLPFVRLVVLLFLIRRGRLSCWVRGLTASSHETLLLSCRRPVTLGLHSVALPLEHVKLSGTCWILVQMVEWTRLIASLCSFGRLLLFLLQNWVVSFVDCCVASFRKSGGLQMWLQFSKVPYRRLSATIGRFRLHQFCRRFLKGWSLCVLFVLWRDLGSCLNSHQYSYRKRLGTCDALLDIVCAGQLELDRGGELALVQIDFSAAFDRVNHGGLVFKLREAGVGGLILKVFQNFLSSRTQRVKVDGVFSSSIDVVSGVPQGSVLGPLLFLLYIGDLPRLLQNELVGYADDTTLLCRIPHPRVRSSVAA